MLSGYSLEMDTKRPDPQSRKRWDDARHRHWHGAAATSQTSEREAAAETARSDEAGKADDATEAGETAEGAEAAETRDSLAHEGRVTRWEQATGRTWNREHGTGGQS
ncbi:hypothetical protein GCM10017608_04580 [Agromyces luteolus]|nr:hypothetical protein GCM10017608_04580 [Agromyces luteolus]